MPDSDAKAQESKDQPTSSATTRMVTRRAAKPQDPPVVAESSASPSKPAAAPILRDKPSWAATGNKPGHYKPWNKKTEEEKQAAMKLLYGTTECMSVFIKANMLDPAFLLTLDCAIAPFKITELYDNQEDIEYEESATRAPSTRAP